MTPPPPTRQVTDETTVRFERHATTVLIVMNVAFYLYELWLYRENRHHREWFMRTHALSIDGLRHGLWWQFLTFQFLHGGWVHLLMNLLLLHSLGPVMETTLGRWRFVTLYLVSGSVGGLLQLVGAWLSPRYFGAPVVGASAGLCGLLAALAAVYSEERLRVLLFFVIPLEVRAKFILLFAAVMSAVGAIYAFGNIAHLAHLGGLVGGLWCINWWRIEPAFTALDDPSGPPAPPNPR
jgi:membrane associated rhomboid family serine protease